ncbi:hypothetical protein BH18THE2_BH18THE2_23940 [soil metagenome]
MFIPEENGSYSALSPLSKAKLTPPPIKQQLSH